jgi:hypothetical protein
MMTTTGGLDLTALTICTARGTTRDAFCEDQTFTFTDVVWACRLVFTALLISANDVFATFLRNLHKTSSTRVRLTSGLFIATLVENAFCRGATTL